MRALIYRLVVGVALVGCSNTAPVTGIATLDRPGRAAVNPVAEQTALLTLMLEPDGSAALTAISSRPISFRGRRLLPFDPAKHDPGKAVRRATAVQHPQGPGSAPDAAAPVLRSDAHVLVVWAPALETPLVVPLELGSPGEGGGDVLDRWSHQPVLVRAPSFGEGTRYTLLRQGADQPTVMAERTEGR